MNAYIQLFLSETESYINSDDGNVIVQSAWLVLWVVDILCDKENDSTGESACWASPKVDELWWSRSSKAMGSGQGPEWCNVHGTANISAALQIQKPEMMWKVCDVGGFTVYNQWIDTSPLTLVERSSDIEFHIFQVNCLRNSQKHQRRTEYLHLHHFSYDKRFSICFLLLYLWILGNRSWL